MSDATAFVFEAAASNSPIRMTLAQPRSAAHGGHGRLLKYDPANGKTTVLLGGLQFANGVALAADPRE